MESLFRIKVTETDGRIWYQTGREMALNEASYYCVFKFVHFRLLQIKRYFVRLSYELKFFNNYIEALLKKNTGWELTHGQIYVANTRQIKGTS